MTKNEEKIKDIILEYCQGINHLEFDLEYLPEMIARIAALNKVASSQPIISESKANGVCQHSEDDVSEDEDGHMICGKCGTYGEDC